MATTITNTFTASAHAIEITDEDSNVWSNQGNSTVDEHRDQVVRACRREFNANGTTSCTITISVS